MNILEKVLLFLHLLGMAFLLGGLLTQLTNKDKILNRGIRDGAYAQIITGPLLMWVQLSSDNPEKINDIVISLKMLVVTAIVVLILLNKKSKKLTNNKFYALLILALSAVALAIFLY
jgi:hypothetical protein